MKKLITTVLVASVAISLAAGCIISKTKISTSNKVSKQSKVTSSSVKKAAGVPNVYMTTDISPKGLMDVYKALNRPAKGKVAIKLTVGEPTDTYYLSPKLIKNLVQSVKGTFVDCNTAYGGMRTTTAMHMQVAKDHGFTKYAKFDVLDSDGGYINLPIKNGKYLKNDMVGTHYKNYDFVIVLSHFKGHPMAGFGGAIKNMSIGFAVPKMKNLIHTAGKSTIFTPNPSQDSFLDSMAEAAKAIADNRGKHILYISVMNNLSVDCDCVAYPAAPEMKDIGILASLDPVALDKACVDQVYKAKDGEALQQRIELFDGTHILDYAQKIGLGSKKYHLVKLK